MPEQVVLPQWLHKPMPETLCKDDFCAVHPPKSRPALVGQVWRSHGPPTSTAAAMQNNILDLLATILLMNERNQQLLDAMTGGPTPDWILCSYTPISSTHPKASV